MRKIASLIVVALSVLIGSLLISEEPDPNRRMVHLATDETGVLHDGFGAETRVRIDDVVLTKELSYDTTELVFAVATVTAEFPEDSPGLTMEVESGEKKISVSCYLAANTGFRATTDCAIRIDPAYLADAELIVYYNEYIETYHDALAFDLYPDGATAEEIVAEAERSEPVETVARVEEPL
ncbi:MAG: hypothetical protein LBM23_03000 [Propionibacteriaceae bacterium]|jgi:hypothetical protein|nr:hypothetical protein [Propionibacteriaceae bacterium]